MRIASVCPEPNRFTCSIAASSDGTTADAHLEREELAREVVVGGHAHRRRRGRGRRRRRRARRPARASASATRGQERVGDRLVHEQRLGRVAHARALRLRVDHDVERAVEVGRRVDVDWQLPSPSMMTGTVALSRMLWMSAGPPRGMRQSTYVGELHQLDRGLVATSSTSSTRVVGEPGLGEPVAQRRRRSRGSTAARSPSPRRSAALPDFRQMPGGVAGDVGPVLVDDRDHAERHPHPLDLEPVGPDPAVERPRRSGRAARRPARRPSAMPSMRASVRRSRSSGPASIPPAVGGLEVDARWRRGSRRRCSTSRSAAASRAAFFSAVDAGGEHARRAPGPPPELEHRRRDMRRSIRERREPGWRFRLHVRRRSDREARTTLATRAWRRAVRAGPSGLRPQSRPRGRPR